MAVLIRPLKPATASTVATFLDFWPYGPLVDGTQNVFGFSCKVHEVPTPCDDEGQAPN